MPDWVVSSLAVLGEMPEKEYEAFLRAFASTGPTLHTSAVAGLVAQSSGMGSAKAHMLIHALIGLAGPGDTGDTSGDPTADIISTSPELVQAGIDTEALAERVAKLIEVVPFQLLHKASDLSSEHANIFLDARVITDIRPIFGTAPDGPPEGALLSHTLKLEILRDEGEVEHFYLVLDDEDLNKLSHLIRRAKQKATSLRSVLSRVEITHVGLEH